MERGGRDGMERWRGEGVVGSDGGGGKGEWWRVMEGRGGSGRAGD